MKPADPSHPASPAPGDSNQHPLDWPERAGATGALLHELQARARVRMHRRRGVVTAGIVVVIAGLWWSVAERARTTPGAPASSVTVLAPARRVLADGSVVDLKEGAEIAVDYREKFRRVVLRRGEAHFQVAKNAARPFIVSASGVEVRAVGTAFSVQMGAAEVEVLVTEGRVAVDKIEDRRAGAPASDRAPAPASMGQVAAGERAVISLTAHPSQVQAVSKAELDRRLSWRVPRLEFSGTPLDEAIPMFNRYSQVRLLLGEPSLNRLRLSGKVRADNVDALVRLLEANYGIRAERRGENEIVLRRAN